MAQFDTGLGWSANQGWLVRAESFLMGEIGGFGGQAFPGQPIPKNCVNDEGIVAGGFVMYTRTYSGQPATVYAGVYADYDVLAYMEHTGTNYFPRFISLVNNITIRTVTVRDSTGAIISGNTYNVNLTKAYAGTTFYYNSAGTVTPVNTNVPIYDSIDSAVIDVQINAQPFYKLNQGFAVACIASWHDLAGDAVSAPILISTNQDYIKLSLDGTTDAQATELGFRWQNVTFYMALLTGYSGEIANLHVPPADLTAAFPGPTTISTVAEAIARAANIQVITTPDPYGGDAQPGGGEGNPDEDEEIDFSTPPTVGSYVGFFRMWNPTETELRQLASWMWSGAFDLDTFKRIFSAPIDAILGLSLVPVQPAVIGGYTIVLGGIDTGISAFTVTSRYVTMDCGSLTVDERWGAYLDYSPFTKLSIFLPYIGFRDISTDDVMGKTVALQYNVDVLSGACVAELKCGGSVLYSWQGNCAQQLPITSADWSNALSAALGLAGTAAAAIVTGGGSLPLAGTVASATVNALSLKPRMERGGSISGAAGAMAGQVPYLVRERPEQAVPGRQNHFIGYPSFTTVTLGSIAGYTEVESIHLEGIPATAAELSELESILKEGFIL